MSIKMLSNSVQIALFIILWVTKLIHNKQPMYAVLDKDTIKNERNYILSTPSIRFSFEVSKPTLKDTFKFIVSPIHFFNGVL